ncbi:hypothetical protein AMELA_G00259700 [Ameiurus melas]|uniref:Uncharacterized protein n=1 Tax=Ameiurus melas TaxID=219545 RepID=A0A7J5ZQI1_AMEME|nr:hypothetical protein AMELA_G00259700 [Ameiurus melas]
MFLGHVLDLSALLSFMLDVANELFDDFSDKDKKIKRIKDMPLSVRTVHDRTIMMANQIEATQVKDLNAAPFLIQVYISVRSVGDVTASTRSRKRCWC